MKSLFLLFFMSLSSLSFSQTQIFDSLTIELNEYKLTHPTDTKDKRIFNLLKNLYKENLQLNTGLSKATAKEYNDIKNSEKVLNKSIFFLFNKYQDHITETAMIGNSTNPDFQIAVMNLLASECMETYKEIPAIVLVYMGEALLSANMIEKATKHFILSLKSYPDSIPIKVYLVLLDSKNKKALKQQLIKNHSNHWMVKQLILKKEN